MVSARGRRRVGYGRASLPLVLAVAGLLSVLVSGLTVSGVAVSGAGSAAVPASGPASVPASGPVTASVSGRAAPVVEVLDPVVAPGAQVWVRGSGFVAGERVRVSVAGVGSGGLLGGRIVAGAGGVASGQVTVPSHTGSGVAINTLPQPVVVELTGVRSGRVATGVVEVKEMWATGDYSPMGNAVNPVEDTLTPGNVDQVELRYRRRFELPIGPKNVTVREGRLYVATSNSSATRTDVMALDAATGEQVWSTPLQTRGNWGTAVSGDGKWLYVGTSTAVFGLDAVTGAVRWEYPTELNDGIPRIVGDRVVFNAGNRNWTTAVNRFTGKRVWGKAGLITDRWEVLAAVLVADGLVYQPAWTDPERGEDYVNRAFRVDTGTLVKAAQMPPGGPSWTGLVGSGVISDKYLITLYDTYVQPYLRREKRWLEKMHQRRWMVRRGANTVVVGDRMWATTQISTRAGLFAVALPGERLLWKRPDAVSFNALAGVAYANGMIIGPAIDAEGRSSVTATDAETGEVLWTSEPLGTDIHPYGIPAVVDGAIYVPTTNGDLYTWALPSTSGHRLR